MPTNPEPSEPVFNRPTSVFIGGSSRPLLNWVAYALALRTNPNFLWSDVRIPGELFDKNDLLARRVIPADQLSFVYPTELARDHAAASTASAHEGSPPGPGSDFKTSVGFLQLPSQARDVLTALPPGGPPIPIVVSNAHRIVGLYPTSSVAPILKAVLGAGAILIMTFADAPPDGRLSFDTVLHLNGHDPADWKSASLRVEKSPADGPFKSGATTSLKSFAPIADVLSRTF